MHGTHSQISGQDDPGRFCVMATNIATGERRLLVEHLSKRNALAVCRGWSMYQAAENEFYTVEPEAQR